MFINLFILGVKIGEIGCKLGMNGTNQGYLGFEHVRIPRENMLMKNSKVLKVIRSFSFLYSFLFKLLRLNFRN